MTTVYCDCADCYNNDEGSCALDVISMSRRMTGGGWLTLCDDYQEINREDFEPQESDHNCHTCKHYISGERDGSCGSYICKNYSNWERSDKE